jgi:rhomboid protease GluP
MTDFEPQPIRYLPLPMSQPLFTYPLIGLIAIMWLYLAWLAGGDSPMTYSQLLVDYGANFGQYIINKGEVWRFFTSMFLHGGLTHLLFNGYALFVFGLEMERIFGPERYIVIYILSGLFGSLASFATKGNETFSVGASGAIFGIIGMSLAFFWLHKDKMGQFGRQRMSSILFIVGFNLFLGYTIPGIDNMAHIGGLIAGLLLGLGLAPQYEIEQPSIYDARLVDKVTLVNRWWVTAFSLLILVTLTQLAINFWR